MARLARLALAGVAHHVLQVGHGGQAVFADDADRTAYVDMLRDASRAEQVAVHGYALLDNEVHLLVTPHTPRGLSRLMQAVGRRYGLRFNRRHGRSGTLWDGRFRAAPIEPDPWVLRSLAWMETAGGCAAARSDHANPWCSAAHHLGARRDALIAEHPAYWQLGNTPFEREHAWRRCLEAGLPAAQASQLLDAVRHGWALGGAAFLSGLGRLTARPLVARPRGRPAGGGRARAPRPAGRGGTARAGPR
jgi:putative transposase